MGGHSCKCVCMSQTLPACCMLGNTYTLVKMGNLFNSKHHKNKYLKADVCIHIHYAKTHKELVVKYLP